MTPPADTSPQDERQRFWSRYQPGLSQSDTDASRREHFDEIERRRYELEPDILEAAAFESTAGLDVLDAGCGIATDGARFARAGARYTGVDFSPTALENARHRFALEGLDGRFVEGSLTDLPFPDASFDLVYSMGVIHHIPEIERVVSEFRRVLRPRGRVVVMVYHRDSFNYRVTILGLKRLLTVALLVPGGVAAVHRATREPLENLHAHRELLRHHGLRYLRDTQLFLDNNTDGPGNPYSQVYSARDASRLFAAFSDVQTSVGFLHLRSYPGGKQMARTALADRLGRRWGWHLWISARRP